MWHKLSNYYDYLCFGVFSIIGGIYILRNANYLDDPRVTPPPPPTGMEHFTSTFVTSSWFGALLLIGGVIILCGVLGDRRIIRNIGLSWIAPLYSAEAYVFIMRGLFDYHFNLTWAFAGLAIALLLGTAMRGGRRS